MMTPAPITTRDPADVLLCPLHHITGQYCFESCIPLRAAWRLLDREYSVYWAQRAREQTHPMPSLVFDALDGLDHAQAAGAGEQTTA